MKGLKSTIAELIAAGYLGDADAGAAQKILAPYHAQAADAEKSKRFAVEDKAHQAQVISDAQELAETDLEMGQIEDRFVQAEVIENADSLADKDDALFEKADAMLVAACGEAAAALSKASLVEHEDLEAVTRLIAGLWNTNVKDKS